MTTQKDGFKTRQAFVYRWNKNSGCGVMMKCKMTWSFKGVTRQQADCTYL